MNEFEMTGKFLRVIHSWLLKSDIEINTRVT